MQIAVASTFKNSEPDQLAEADDIDSLGDFLEDLGCSGGVHSQISEDFFVCDHTQISRGPTPLKPIPVDFDLVPSELALDNLDEEAEERKKLSKEKQQAG